MPKPTRPRNGGSNADGPNKPHNRRQKRKSSDDSDLEDNVLVSMVTTWVNDDDEDAATAADNDSPAQVSKRAKRHADHKVDSTPPPAVQTPVVYSVHVTQLAFTATDMDIRQHFVDKGISIQSLRMVHDRGVDGRRQFRGVAFIDLADKKSYELSLSLNKSLLKGRKINVRPTKSKEELTDIVAVTSRKVAEKIRRFNDEKDAAEGGEDRKPSPRKPSPRNRDAANRRIQRKQTKNRK